MKWNEIVNTSDIKINKIGIIEQRDFVDSVIANCLEIQSDGMAKVDFTLKELYTFLNVIIYLTDIEINDVLEKMYEKDENEKVTLHIEPLIELYNYMTVLNDYYKYIFNNFDWGTLEVFSILDKEIYSTLALHNDLGAIANRFLNKIVKVVETNMNEKSIKSIIKAIDKFDFNKYPKIKEVYDTIKGGGQNASV